jgi:tetratricopeptide (TPR) repeat protein
MRLPIYLKASLLGVVALILVACAHLSNPTLQTDLRSADQSLQDKQYGVAVTKYLALLGGLDPGPTHAAVLFRLAVCYYSLNSYYDARQSFESYLKLYPEGNDADRSSRYLEKIRLEYNTKEEQYQAEIQKETKRISELKALAEKNFQDARYHFELGNAYWDLAQYQEAVKEYFRAIELDRSYGQNALIKSRLIFDLEGNIVPFAPRERIELEREKNPILIYNTFASRARDWYRSQQNIYIVTGQVKNQSTKPVLNLCVEVTLFNTYGNILDVKTTYLGNIFPQEIRSFRVDFSTISNIADIDYFECKPIFAK